MNMAASSRATPSSISAGPMTTHEMMNDAVMVVDRNGQVVFTNRAANETLELNAQTLCQALGVASLRELPEDKLLDAVARLAA